MTNQLPENRIKSDIPEALLQALSRRHAKYTDMVAIFHCIHVGDGVWVGVAGDGDNGSYEAFLFEPDKVLVTTDQGFGCVDDTLQEAFRMGTKKGVR